MRVHDIGADVDVTRDRNTLAIPGGANADVAIGKVLFFNRAADRLAEPFVPRVSFPGNVVDLAGLEPHAELAGFDVAGHVFARRPNAGQLEIMYDARPVGGHVRHKAPLDEVDEIARQALL